MTYWVSADQVFDGRDLLSDCAVQFSGDKVTAIKSMSDIPTSQVDRHHAGLLTPGFFDIQVNGGGGVLLNSTPTRDGIAKIIAAHRTYGTVAMLPTVITDGPEVLEKAVDAALEARDLVGFAGLHIEGPHISTSRRGTHAAQHIRPFDANTLTLVRRLHDGGVPALITLAPEAATTSDIATLRDVGAVVSIGHSDVTASEASRYVAAGATCFTHLFNAMSPMLNRAPGVTGAAIASDAWCSIIADGIHVDPTMIMLAARARPLADRMIAVSDAMSTVGGPAQFDLYGQSIRLDGGRLVNAEGSLAGAHLSLHEALQNLVSYGMTLETALRMCRTNSYALMGLQTQSRLVGLDACDVVLLDAKLAMISVGVTATTTTSETV